MLNDAKNSSHSVTDISNLVAGGEMERIFFHKKLG